MQKRERKNDEGRERETRKECKERKKGETGERRQKERERETEADREKREEETFSFLPSAQSEGVRSLNSLRGLLGPCKCWGETGGQDSQQGHHATLPRTASPSFPSFSLAFGPSTLTCFLPPPPRVSRKPCVGSLILIDVCLLWLALALPVAVASVIICCTSKGLFSSSSSGLFPRFLTWTAPPSSSQTSLAPFFFILLLLLRNPHPLPPSLFVFEAGSLYQHDCLCTSGMEA